MYIREYGKENSKILLFFPGSCEPWEEHAYSAKALAVRFHVLQVVPDGEDPKEHTDFISVEKTVDDTARWLREHGIREIDALYGLSYGGAMALRFLVSQDIHVKKAVFDGATAPYEYPKWLCRIICVRDFLMIKLASNSLAVMKIAAPPERLARDKNNVDAEYRDIMNYLQSYSNRTFWNIFWSANNYAVPHPAPVFDTDMQFWIGEDEWGSRYRDLKWYRKYLPQMRVVRIPHMMHGEFVMMYPKEFARKAIAFFEGGNSARRKRNYGISPMI